MGQAAPARISPDESEKHLIKKPPAIYPSLAETTHIQGNVIIEIGIDESGAVFSRRLVSGHPLLAPAALEAVTRWKYQPFVVEGRPVRVVTITMVTFGNPSNHQAEDRAEILFQHNFWTSEEAAQIALASRDYPGAEQQLNNAWSLLAQMSDTHRHPSERWQWMMTMGRVRAGQQKYEDAEQYYKKALTLRQGDDKDAPEVAATLANLGSLYAAEKQFDMARDYTNRSVSIYRKNFKRVGSGNPGSQQAYGRAIAYQSWMLAKLASQQNDPAEASKQCGAVFEFQTFLSATDHESVVAACQDTIGHSGPKN